MDASDFILSAIAAQTAPAAESTTVPTDIDTAPALSAPAAALIVPAVETDFDINTAAMTAPELQYWNENREFIRDAWNSTDAAYQFYAIDYKVKAELVRAAYTIATTGNIATPMPPISSRDNREMFAVLIATGQDKPAAPEKTAMEKFVAECIATNAKATALSEAGATVKSTKVTLHADDSVSSEIMSGWTLPDAPAPAVAGFVPSDACPAGQTPPGVSAATHCKTTAGWFPLSDCPPGQVAASIAMGAGSNGKSDSIPALVAGVSNMNC